MSESRLRAEYRGVPCRVVSVMYGTFSHQYMLQSADRTVYVVNSEDPDLVLTLEDE